MFTTTIENVPVFGDCADLFPQITRNGVQDGEDQAIISVARALLPTRLPEGTTVTINKHIGKYPTGETLKDIPWTLSVMFTDDNEVRGNYGLNLNKASGWSNMIDIEEFINSKTHAEIEIYTNPDMNSTVIIGPIDNKIEHVIAFFIPRFFKSLFINNKPNENEMKVLNGLLGIGPRGFIDAIRGLADILGYSAKASAMKMATVSRLFMRSALRTAQNDVTVYQSNLDDAYRRYKDVLKRLFDARMKAEGLLASIEKNNAKDDELYEFMLENPHIRTLSVTDDGEIQVIINNYLDIYDADGFELFSDGFYRGLVNTSWTEASDIKLLLGSIFSADPIFRVRTCGIYILNTLGYANTLRGYDYQEEDRIPNPHLQYHACLGQNSGQIADLMKEGNMIAALMQCNASVMSVNVHETGATFTPFCRDLLGTHKKVLELADGTRMNATEALEYLKKQKEESAE